MLRLGRFHVIHVIHVIQSRESVPRHGLDILDALQVHVAKRHFTQALSNLQPSVPMEVAGT